MRDILNDLGDGLSHEDPVRRAQIKSKPELPKRFYKAAGVASHEDGFVVQLDGKSVRTPAKNALKLPTEELAKLIAAEWEAQIEHVNPLVMPVTRLANTAIDGIALDPQAVKEDILRFAGTDLLCYRADTPQSLVELQAESWDPVVDWVHAALGARFVLAEGIVHVEQPREAIAAFGVHLAAFQEPVALASLHSFTSLTGSALLAMAVAKEELTAEEAWSAAHVDEDWNLRQWGHDDEAAARRTYRWTEMQAADNALKAL
ncbi:MAG: ATP12 family chaperone protein [Alphaproteobacteria bacterium]|nr:ATP12 family chaperone protein [Alphaproteobacteria bacterium]